MSKPVFYIFIKISLNPAIRPYDKEGIKEKRLSGILGYPPQSFLSVPQLDSVSCSSPDFKTNYENRPKVFATSFIRLVLLLNHHNY